MTNSFNWLCPPVVIIREQILCTFQSYILFLNIVTDLSKLSIIKPVDAGPEPTVWLRNTTCILKGHIKTYMST